MLIWIIVLAVTAIACAALFYAAGPRAVNVSRAQTHDADGHFRAVLAGIDADVANGRLNEPEAASARAELAREVLRIRAEAGRMAAKVKGIGNAPLLSGIVGAGLVALALYAVLGRPDLPAEPLAERAEVRAQSMDLNTAVARIEAALAANPADLRGWTAIAPAYVELGRYADAVRAYRQVIALGTETPDILTNLAEALLLESNGAGSGEAMQLLDAAAAADPTHVRSRLYRAAELTRQGRYDDAVAAWNAVIALSKGDEAWLPAAQQGLAVASNNGAAPADAAQDEAIAAMVEGLATRLAANGGSIEEWTQLVRAYIVLGQRDKAQAAFDNAVAAYPQTFDRGELDALALGAGLTLNGGAP